MGRTKDSFGIEKPKNYQAPPMGGIIKHDYIGIDDKFDRYLMIYDYVIERIEHIEDNPNEPISRLEIEDIKDLCDDLLDYYTEKETTDQFDYILVIHKENI